jgi:hypothetical protein
MQSSGRMESYLGPFPAQQASRLLDVSSMAHEELGCWTRSGSLGDFVEA